MSVTWSVHYLWACSEKWKVSFFQVKKMLRVKWYFSFDESDKRGLCGGVNVLKGFIYILHRHKEKSSTYIRLRTSRRSLMTLQWKGWKSRELIVFFEMQHTLVFEYVMMKNRKKTIFSLKNQAKDEKLKLRDDLFSFISQYLVNLNRLETSGVGCVTWKTVIEFPIVFDSPVLMWFPSLLIFSLLQNDFSVEFPIE